MAIDLGTETITHELSDDTASITIKYSGKNELEIIAVRRIIDKNTGEYLRRGQEINRTNEQLQAYPEFASLLSKLPELMDKFKVEDDQAKPA